MLFLTTKFIKIAFRAPSLKSKCQTLGVTISWLVGAGVWGIYTWVLSNWLGKLNAWQDFPIMGQTCPAWLLGLAGYCWALSPMGIFSLFLLKKLLHPLSLSLVLLLFRWCFSILIIQCCSPPLLTLSTKLHNIAKNSTPYGTRVIGRMGACVLRPVVLQLTILSFSPSICLSFCLSLYLSYLSLYFNALFSVSLSLSLSRFSLLDCHSICHQSLWYVFLLNT